jgi:hypothetical protein
VTPREVLRERMIRRAHNHTDPIAKKGAQAIVDGIDAGLPVVVPAAWLGESLFHAGLINAEELHRWLPSTASWALLPDDTYQPA